MPTPELIALARAAAAKHALDPALVCAVIEQESAWDTHAIRYEPGFRTRYVAPQGLPPTEEIARSISWGLMQVMGQLAREHGFQGKFLSALCDPALGLEIGCAALAAKITIRQSSVEATGPGGSAGRSGSADPTALPMSDASCKSAGSVEATGSGGSAGLQAREKSSKLEKGFSPGAPEEPQILSPDTGEGIAPTASTVEAAGSGGSAGRSGSADPTALPMSDASRKSAGSVEATGSGGSAGLQAREKSSKLEKGFSPGAPEEPQILSPDAGEGIAPAEIARALERWNGGANPNYAAEVLARFAHYK